MNEQLTEKEIESITKAYSDYPDILEKLLEKPEIAKQLIYDFDLMSVNGSSSPISYSPIIGSSSTTIRASTKHKFNFNFNFRRLFKK